jgi:hypothetical protein
MIPRGWEFYFAAQGYKEGESKGAGSTRVVWYWKTEDMFIVLKLFQNQDGTIRKHPRTIKFWNTPNFAHDKMQWASSANEFKPSEAEYKSYVLILNEYLDLVRRAIA